jgi:hypothetical protein
MQIVWQMEQLISTITQFEKARHPQGHLTFCTTYQQPNQFQTDGFRLNQKSKRSKTRCLFMQYTKFQVELQHLSTFSPTICPDDCSGVFGCVRGLLYTGISNPRLDLSSMKNSNPNHPELNRAHDVLDINLSSIMVRNLGQNVTTWEDILERICIDIVFHAFPVAANLRGCRVGCTRSPSDIAFRV